MLNTKKLLYILPDVAYVAELLPAKKEHSFAIQAFRQINGEFLTDEDDLIAENIEKLINKIDPDEYHLVLPDFLFTNTIIEVNETGESKVKSYIKDKLLPSLELSKETHAIETALLTEHQGKTKVQLSAIEKSVLTPVVKAAQERGVTISAVSPLSWTIKSVISLEPSISVIQIGSILYVALHYIGVDQTTMSQVDEIENVGETIKTLKGSEPSIQTVYLLTNELVADRLKQMVSSTLPIQQLASFKEEETQMPSYVKQIIESGMKTLDITEYPVPRFELPREVASTPAAAKTEEVNAPAVIDGEEDSDLPKPQSILSSFESKPQPEPEIKTSTESLDEPSQPIEIETPILPAVEPKPPIITESKTLPELPAQPPVPSLPMHELPALPAVSANLAATAEPDLHQFAPSMHNANQQPTMPKEDKPTMSEMSTPFTPATPSHTEAPTVIKNKPGVNNMLKMIFITLAVFFATIGVGVGIGLGVLSLSNKSNTNDKQTSPLADVSPSPLASIQPSLAPSPSASPSASTTPTASGSARSKLNLLVVNATSIAGHAADTKNKLTAAGYKNVKVGNAKGEYQPGYYVLMKTEDTTFIADLEKATGLTLDYQSGIATEDPQGSYDAVIVLDK